MRSRLTLKILSFVTLAILALVILAVVTLLYIDPTKMIKQIESLAEQQGIELDLYGEIDWSFFPRIDLYVRGATASHIAEDIQVNADIQSLNISLKTLPALRGNFQFVGIEIDGGHLDIVTKTTPESGGSSEKMKELSGYFDELSGLLPQVNISRLQITDFTVRHSAQPATGGKSANGTSQTLRISSLDAENMSVTGAPFALRSELQPSSLPNGYRDLVLDSYVAIDSGAKTFRADLQSLKLIPQSGDPEAQITSEGRIQFNLKENSWLIDTSLVDTNAVGVTTKLKGRLSPLAGEGHFEINLTSVPEWVGQENSPPAELPVDLLALETTISINSDSVHLSDMKFRVDSTPGAGSVRYGFGERPTLSADLRIPTIDLDPYLDSETEQIGRTRQPEGATASSGISEDMIETLRAFDAIKVELSVEQMTFSGHRVKDWSVKMDMNRGTGTVALPAASLAGGSIAATISADFSTSTDVNIEASANGLALDQLSTDGSGNPALDGSLGFDYKGQFDNVTRQHLLRGLQGAGEFEFDSLRISAMNLEQTLCESAELLGASAALQTNWDRGTLLGAVRSPFVVTDGLFTVRRMPFNYGNMNAVADTRLDIFQSNLEMNVELSVNGDKTSDTGCSLNKYLRGVRLPMQCSGALGADGSISCGLDVDVIKQLVTKEVGNRVIDEVLDQLGGSDDSDDSDGSKDSEQKNNRDQIRDVLEGLLDNLSD